MLFYLFYIVFLVSMSFGGPFHIGPTTPRQVMAFLMLCYCIFNISLIKKYFNKYILLYFGYLFCLFASSLFENTLDTFVRNFISQHMVAIVCYFSAVLYYEKEHNLNTCIYTILGCGIINMFVCILQYTLHPLGIELGYLFIQNEESIANRHLEQLIDGTQGIYYYLIGLKADAVHNGHFQMIMPFFALYLYRSFSGIKKFFINRFLIIVLLIALIIVIFLIQERSCFLFFLLVFAFYVFIDFRSQNSANKILFLILCLALCLGTIIIVGPNIEHLIANSRFSADDPNIRTILWSNAIEYGYNHLLVGEPTGYIEQNGFPPHNIFLNALIFSGVFGLLFASILFVKQLIVAYKVSLIENPSSLISLAFIAYSLNSLLHNDSIISGDAFAWLLWGMTFSIFFNEKEI